MLLKRKEYIQSNVFRILLEVQMWFQVSSPLKKGFCLETFLMLGKSVSVENSEIVVTIFLPL